MNQIVNMVMRMLMRRLINTGINKGIGKLSRGGGEQESRGESAQKRKPGASPGGGTSARHLRRSTRMIRRVGRF